MKAFAEPQPSGNAWIAPVRFGGTLPEEPQQALRFPQAADAGLFMESLERQMSDFAVQHQEALAGVRRNFVLPADPTQVTSFFSAHRTIPQILLEAVEPLRTYFGADAVFQLRTLIDDSGSQTLYAVVMWPGSLRDVRTRLAGFDEGWWIEHSHQASGHLTFTYELI